MVSCVKHIVEVPVEALKKGLYVSRLDRPWIDSPFLFQGFEIESDEDLTQLRDLCRTVYVEVSAAEADELRAKPVSKKAPQADSPAVAPSTHLQELATNPSARVALVPHKDPTPLKAEMSAAKAIYGDARRSVSKMFDKLRRGGGLDIQMMETVVDSMIDSIFRNREAMSWLARMKTKDDYLYSHSLAVSVWAIAFGRHLGLDRESMRSLGMGAMVLDIGKMQIPTQLLQKSGKPTTAEWASLQDHVRLGAATLEADPKADAFMKSMVLTHHERLDGSGYPNALSGDAIPLAGRIAAIIDSYDAMISDRHYAKGRSTYEAVRELKRLGKTSFQPELVELFIQAVGVFPAGTLVELNTGEVGVVIAQNRFRRLRPEVMLILDGQKKIREEFLLIDLQMYIENNDAGNPALWITQGLEPGAFGVDPKEFFL
jgi:HD-GYP domain-containing protein (c-di-GMP phosphodiesterase class II)